MDTLIQRLREQRLAWMDLGEGKRVRVSRPPETSMPGLIGGVTLDHIKRYVVGWDGITEADLLGAAVGSSDPVAFMPELWAEVIEDRAEWAAKISAHIVETVTVYLEQRKAAAGN